MNERIKSTKIIGVDCKIGRKSRTGSTVSMSISDMDVLEAVKLFNVLETGEVPKQGLKGMELHFVYAEDEQEEVKVEKMIENISDSLEAVKEDEVGVENKGEEENA